MPWRKGDFPPSMRNLPKATREKAVEIATALLKEKHMEAGIAIAIGVKNALAWAKKHQAEAVLIEYTGES